MPKSKISKTRKLIITFILVVLITSLWLWQNPIGEFGFNRYGLIVYSGIPFPAVDIIVGVGRLPSIRSTKAHQITIEEFNDLVNSRSTEKPEVVIIGTGFDGLVRVDKNILESDNPRVEILPTNEAVTRYNQLRDQGVRVMAIIHSTC